MKAYVLIQSQTGSMQDVVRQLRSVDGVVEAHMTFGPYDAVAEIVADDLPHLGVILANRIQPIPGVVETLTCMAVDD